MASVNGTVSLILVSILTSPDGIGNRSIKARGVGGALIVHLLSLNGDKRYYIARYDEESELAHTHTCA